MNGDELQFQKIDALGLDTGTITVVLSEQVGARKPDPRIFHEALRRLGNPDPSTVLMIGDDPDADILGAPALGMVTAWVAAGRRWDERAYRPDIMLEDFIPLLKLFRDNPPPGLADQEEVR